MLKGWGGESVLFAFRHNESKQKMAEGATFQRLFIHTGWSQIALDVLPNDRFGGSSPLKVAANRITYCSHG